MVRMMITVVTAFTLCWLPLNALIVAGDQDTRIWQYKHIVYVWFACHWLAMSHAAYNPIIYCWMNNRFREGFLRIYQGVSCTKGSGSSRSLHRCNTYTTYTSNLSVHSKYRNGKPSPTPSTRLTVQHVCRYDGCVTDEEMVNDSPV